MRGVQVVRIALEEPAPALHDVPQVVAVRRLALFLLHSVLDVCQQFGVDVLGQQFRAVRPALVDRILREVGDGATGAVVLEDQFEALLRMNLFVICNFNDAV